MFDVEQHLVLEWHDEVLREITHRRDEARHREHHPDVDRGRFGELEDDLEQVLRKIAKVDRRAQPDETCQWPERPGRDSLGVVNPAHGEH